MQSEAFLIYSLVWLLVGGHSTRSRSLKPTAVSAKCINVNIVSLMIQQKRYKGPVNPADLFFFNGTCKNYVNTCITRLTYSNMALRSPLNTDLDSVYVLQHTFSALCTSPPFILYIIYSAWKEKKTLGSALLVMLHSVRAERLDVFLLFVEELNKLFFLLLMLSVRIRLENPLRRRS